MEIPDFLKQINNLTSQIIYLVGGGIRDLLMGYKLSDYDLLCQEDALNLAQLLEKQNLATIKSVHKAFGTVKICWHSNGAIIDLATTRQEKYAYSGALPEVNYPAPIEIDLLRRDFSINAIAFNLKTNQFIDPLEGRKDLKNKIIRVLHSNSYWEDPTRIIRAARFANRFDFGIADADLKQIETALEDKYLHGLIQKIRGARVGIELKRLLETENWLEGAKTLCQIGGFNLLRSNLEINLTNPLFCLNSFEARLAWILQKNSLNSLILELEIKNNRRKQINYIFELKQNQNLQPSLKLLAEINKLELDFQNLLFSLNGDIYNLYSKMYKAKPNIKPQYLLQKGLEGIHVMQELEKIFMENFKKQ